MATRYNINDFALANPAYAGGTVSFYTVSGGAKTTTLATLYAASTGSTTLANPRTLDSDGKFSVPVYVEVPTVATVSGLTVADHDTGIMGLAESAAATSAAAALVSENNAETAETNAEAAQAAAEAAAAGVGMRGATTVGGTVSAITATFTPAFASLAASAGIVLAIPMAGANTSTTPTLAIDGLAAKTIVKNSGAALVENSIPGADFVGLFVYDVSLDKFQMLNPTPVLGAEYQAYSANLAAFGAVRADIASATTLDLGATTTHSLNVTGTTATTAITLADGATRILRANAAWPITNGASLIVPGGDYTCAAGDLILAVGEPAGVVRLAIWKADGTAVVAAVPFSVSYTSSAQTITAGGALTLAHSLGAMPTLIQLRLVCQSNEQGYTAGDEVLISFGAMATDYGVSVVPDATNINIRFGSVAAVFIVNIKNNGNSGVIDPTKWKLVVRAWV